ncbi:phosphatase PAP2 family protein [Alysiella filiformis]|nr:phosphatase PAP2 family protein [Alysiella filiformis]QMT32240.1 phosphatase PAP2 family protein [Alysiella filiformis]UBQ56840.1 phosphatase PAP2 family protein [Alysiella filiformis DSM 16848]
MTKWNGVLPRMPMPIQIALFSILMLLVPLQIWCTGYTWWEFESHFTTHYVDLPSFELTLLIPITQTGSFPNAVGMAALLGVLLLLLCWRHHAWQTIVLMCLLSVGGTQFAKSALKQMTQAPRPYVVYLNQNTLPFMGYKANSFYRLPENVQTQAIQESFTPPLAEYLLTAERGFSFPSGHTIFAVSWLLLFVGLLPRWSKSVLLPILTIWAAAVSYSRVKLGMHYPIDLLVSILLAWAWHGFLFARILPQLDAHYPK